MPLILIFTVHAKLQFTYVNTYPEDPPLIEVPSYEGMDDSEAESLREFLDQEVITCDWLSNKTWSIFWKSFIISMFQGCLSFTWGRPEIPVGKSNWLLHSIWEASVNMACDLQCRLRAVSFFHQILIVFRGVYARTSIEHRTRNQGAAQEDSNSMHCISCAFLKKKCRKTSVVQANSKVTFHVPGLSTLQFSCQKITRPWKTILSGLAGSLSFVVSLLSCAFSHAHGHLCVSGILRDRPRKKRDCS